ncbi:MAG: hypothetical protein ACK5Q5_20360, partial [Planctomycetaceae bacterium]
MKTPGNQGFSRASGTRWKGGTNYDSTTDGTDEEAEMAARTARLSKPDKQGQYARQLGWKLNA